MFVEWAYREEYMDHLPRNIGRNYVEMRLPDPDPQPFTLEEVR